MGRRRFGQLEAPPRYWWRRKPPPRAAARVCYRTKTDALNVFRQANQSIIDEFGGESAKHRPSEFDAINHRYGLKGRRRVRTIAGALWAALQGGPPWCLDNIDLDALNATSPGQRGIGFQLPNHVQDVLVEREAEQHYESEAIDEGIVTDCFTKFRSRRRGVFRKDGKRLPRRGEVRERACVCRDDRGRFASCDLPGSANDVPF